MLQSGLLEEIQSLRALVKNRPPRFNLGGRDAENSVGILQAIGYKEFQPYFDALEAGDGLPDPTILKTRLSECVEHLNVATRQYARRQLSWIRNKFVTKNIPVYQLDSTNIDEWEANVAQHAIVIAQMFLKDKKITTYTSVQQLNPSTAETTTLQYKFHRNTCVICGGRDFTGMKQWTEHMRSKGHKYHLKRIEIQKEREKCGEIMITAKNFRRDDS